MAGKSAAATREGTTIRTAQFQLLQMRDLDGRAIEKKAFEFAVRLVRLVNRHRDEMPRPLIDALVEFGAGIGSNVSEAQTAGSRRRYYVKMNEARTACQKTEYWLRLANAGGIVGDVEYDEILAEIQSLKAILTAICARLQQMLAVEQTR